MSELARAYPDWLSIEVTAASIGGFVAGCIYKKPEVIIPTLAVAGAGIIKLVQEVSDYFDSRTDGRAEITRIISELENGF